MDKVGILVVSYGAREAAIVDVFARSPNHKVELYLADKQRNPFNVEKASKHVVIPDLNIEEVCKFAEANEDKIDFAMVGPEKPIIEGGRDLIRELGPVLTALMVSGRAGSAITAEIGIMRITEQLDAMDTMAVNPLQYVVTPKLLAGLICVPLLTAIFDVVGIFGGYLVGVVLLGVSSGSYFNGMVQSVQTLDINGGIVKSLVFGLTIMLVACYKGYFTARGAEGVSRATTETVVLSAVLGLHYHLLLHVSHDPDR